MDLMLINGCFSDFFHLQRQNSLHQRVKGERLTWLTVCRGLSSWTAGSSARWLDRRASKKRNHSKWAKDSEVAIGFFNFISSRQPALGVVPPILREGLSIIHTLRMMLN